MVMKVQITNKLQYLSINNCNVLKPVVLVEIFQDCLKLFDVCELNSFSLDGVVEVPLFYNTWGSILGNVLILFCYYFGS